MEKEIATTHTVHSYAGITELTVIKDTAREGDSSLYLQVQRVLLGLVSFGRITTPFNTLPLDRPFNRAIKRVADILFALLVIVGILSWLIPVLAIIIKLDSPGPVFFTQKRSKRNGTLFTCIKFRSMIVNEEADILPAAEYDKRITRVGRFTRRNYIDELPQFFNVLWGDMSVIGPRPHMMSDNMKYEEQLDHYAWRYKVKPGITGLAQVMGYVGVTEVMRKMKDRVGMDIFYLRHWSVRMDLAILLRTLSRAIGLKAAEKES